MSNTIIIGIIVLALLVIIPMSVKIVTEFERGVIFRLGRLIGAKGPGLFLIIPFVDRMIKVDLRVVTMDVPPQEVITKDNVTVRVNAVVFFRVVGQGIGPYPGHLPDIADDTAQHPGTIRA